jgi:DNA polymerase sigma
VPHQQLDQQLLLLVDQLSATPEQQQRQLAAWQAVTGLLERLWPEGQVHLFGSAANGLGVGNNNDLDVCLELQEVGDTREERGERPSPLLLQSVI